MASLNDPMLKLTRARKHLYELQDLVEPFNNPDLYSITHDFNSDTGEHIFQVVSDVPDIPAECSVVIGDILNNFRSTLEYLVWQLVLANGRTPERSNSFPICGKESQFESQSTIDKLKGVSQAAKDIIRYLQPCYGGNLPLLRLDCLRNIDIHRHLNVAVVNSNHVDVLIPASIRPSQVTPYFNLGPVQKGTVLLRIICPHHDVQFDPTFEVAFSEEAGSGIGVLGGLYRIDYSVENAVNLLKAHVENTSS